MRSFTTPLNLKRAAHGSAIFLIMFALWPVSGGSQAFAEEGYGPESAAMRIHLSDYDLADKRDIRKLHRRISSNARFLCADLLHGVASKVAAYNNCVDNTVRQSVLGSGVAALIEYEERRD